jgi:hypothetical protein
VTVPSGPMLPENRADVPVEVHHVASGFGDDTADGWFPGFIEHRRQTADGGWEAYVRYTRVVGQQHVGWFGYDRLRPLQQEREPDAGD